MAVIAKFFVQQINLQASSPDGETGSVVLQAVSRGAANKEWSKWTPSGSLTMSINNPPAFKFFKDRLGKEMSITIEEFDPPTVEDGHPYVQFSDYNECRDCGKPAADHAGYEPPADEG